MAFEYEPKGWQKKASFLVVALSDPRAGEDPTKFNYHDQSVYPCQTSREMSEVAEAFLNQGAHRVLVFQAWEDSDGRPMWTIFDEVSRKRRTPRGNPGPDAYEFHYKPPGFTGAPCPICECPTPRLKALHRRTRPDETGWGGKPPPAEWVKRVAVCFGTDYAVVPTDDTSRL